MPLPSSTNRIAPSDDTATSVGYHPAGTAPLSSPVRVEIAVTALSPASATNNVSPSRDSARPLGVVPSSECGQRLGSRRVLTRPLARSMTSISPPFEQDAYN